MTRAADARHRARLRRSLTAMERRAAAALGEGATGPVREYVEHHEFALALELLVSLVARAGLPPAGYRRRVETAAARMALSDSEPLAEWRRYCARA